MSKKKTFLRSLIAIGFVTISTTALADDAFISVKPLIADINGNNDGVEIVAPRFTLSDKDQNGVLDTMNIRYDVYPITPSPTPTTVPPKLYSTAGKIGAFPATPCQDPQWSEAYHEPIFARSGNWVATGNMMIAECGTLSGEQDIQNAFVYVADASQAADPARAWTISIPNAILKSMEIIDYDQNGSNELMIMAIKESAGVVRGRIIIKNIETGDTISDVLYPLTTFPVPPPIQ
jgi:hypothetical protein